MSKKDFGDLGPLEALLQDPDIMEIMVNRFDNIYIEKRGKLIKVEDQFRDEAHLMEVIQMIAEPLGRRVDESYPIVDLRLPDGSRVHIAIPPIAIGGANMTIRKFAGNVHTAEALIGFGSWTRELVDFLDACVKSRLNILMSGGTGSGKTTVFNILSSMVYDEERIVVMENAGELVIKKPHMVTLETRPPNFEGRGEVSMQMLVESALKMRPERLLMGEAMKGGEVLAILNAMNTGHDGAMFTLHANSPREAIARLEVMALEANPSMPVLAIREQIASGIDVIIQQQRLRDGSRKVLYITEVIGMDGAMLGMQDIFEFKQTGFEGGRVQGYFTPTGIKPRFLDRLNESGFNFGEEFFQPK